MAQEKFLDCRDIESQHDSLAKLHQYEAAAIEVRRWKAGLRDAEPDPVSEQSPPPRDLVGLALSGGGVRSASFNLGFLQALSQSGFLRYVDYMSSVSGGGYIAGHLTALASLKPTAGQGFHGSPEARLGLAEGEQLHNESYRFRYMGDYLNDYLGFIWRYVLYTIPLLFWALCALGVVGTLLALVWRCCDFPEVRRYFELVGLDRLGLALHIGDEALMAFLPSVPLFVFFTVLGVIRVGMRPARRKKLRNLMHFAAAAWLVSLAVSFAVFLGNGVSSLGASTQTHNIQTYWTWPLIIATVMTFLPLLAGKQLMQSGREHAPRWKKVFFHIFIGGATAAAAFLMVHLMARENISGYATHRDSNLLPEDIEDWPAFLALLENTPGLIEPSPPATEIDDLQKSELDLRTRHEEIVGDTSWKRWQNIPLINLVNGTGQLVMMHWPGGNSALAYIRAWQINREAQRTFLNGRINSRLHDEALTNRLLEIAVYRASLDDEKAFAGNSNAGFLGWLLARKGSGTPGPRQLKIELGLEERKHLGDFITKRSAEMLEGATLQDMALRRVLPGMSFGAENQGRQGISAGDLTAVERAQFNRLLLECLFPKIVRERTMISTTIVPLQDQIYRLYWLGFWSVGFVGLGLLANANRLSPFYSYYRDRLHEYFVCTAPEAIEGTDQELGPLQSDWDKLQKLRPWERGGPYPLMLGSAFFLNKIGVVKTPQEGGAAADAFKLHAFVFSPFYCGTAAAGYCRTDVYGGGDLRLREAMAISGAALTPFMVDNHWFSALMAAFNLRIGQWLPTPAREDIAKRRYWAAPLAIVREWLKSWDPKSYARDWNMTLVADGGFHDFFGIEELLVRRCKLIVVSDAGRNNGLYEFGALADVIRLARERHGIEIVDLDDDQAPDLCGVRRIPGENRQSLHHTCMRIIYPAAPGKPREEALLVYAQMSLTGREQVDLQQFRNIHPNFPDEPVTNQFFTHGQIESYRQLGFHVGRTVCREVRERRHNRPATRREIADDLLLGYLQEYYCHVDGMPLEDSSSAAPAPMSKTLPASTVRLNARLAGDAKLPQSRHGLDSPRRAPIVLAAYRSSWFQRRKASQSPLRIRSNIIQIYERSPKVRARALNTVAQYLSPNARSGPRGHHQSPQWMAILLMACHERNAGTVVSRFVPGGREILLRGVPRIRQMIPMAPLIPTHPDADLTSLLEVFAHAIFEEASCETIADFLICVQHAHGLQIPKRWKGRGGLPAYRGEVMSALRQRNRVELQKLVAAWTRTP